METTRGSYELWDMETNNLIGAYSSQDRMMQTFYEAIRVHGIKSVHDVALMYVTPDEETIYLGDGNETKWLGWFHELEHIKITLRLAGTDIIGLSEHLGYLGYRINYMECQCPLTELCNIRYNANIFHEERGRGANGHGYTRLEALARAYAVRAQEDKR